MANPAFRARWDAVANPKGQKDYPIDTTEEIAVGDLMWWDKRGATPSGVPSLTNQGCARPFNSVYAWTGSTAGTQAKLAENFLGVAMSAHPLPDNPIRSEQQTVRIAGRGAFSYPLTTASVMSIGDLIVASKDPAGNLMYAQQVDRGGFGDPGEPTELVKETAIGKATKTFNVASSMVEFEILGTREVGGGPRQYLTS